MAGEVPPWIEAVSVSTLPEYTVAGDTLSPVVVAVVPDLVPVPSRTYVLVDPAAFRLFEVAVSVSW